MCVELRCQRHHFTGGAPPWAAPLLALPAQIAPLLALPAQIAPLLALPAQIAPLLALPAQIARLANSSATALHHVLQPVPVNGLLPAWFPTTLGDLGAGLSNAHANALMTFYGLPNPHANDLSGCALKSAAIRSAIGVR